jgi:membrane associated rhomboid family serine protease
VGVRAPPSSYNVRMATRTHELMLLLLQACAERDPEPLYPAIYAREQNLDRDKLDAALDELRMRGLIQLTEWVKDRGQGRALTDAGKQALATGNLAPAPAPQREARAAVPSLYERGEMVRDAVFDPPPPWVSWALLALNVGYFLYGVFVAWQLDGIVADYLKGEGRTTTVVLLNLGALYEPLVLPDLRFPIRPQFERIILCTFLHIGILHLAMNMYFLATLGGLVESMWGKLRFLALYLVAGVVSSCVVLSLEMIQQRNAYMAGASGSLYGVFASMLVWLALNKQHLPEQLLQSWSRTLGINLVIMLSMNMLPGVSWQGHLGGAIGGTLAALLLHVQRFHPYRAIRVLALFAVPAVPVAFFVLVLWQAGRI